MIADLKPYPEYRDSGLPWLGQVPAHWRQERAKWLLTKMERPVRDGDGVVTCFRDGMVTLRKNRRLRGFTEAIHEFGYQGIRKGDLVIHAMDAFAGAVGVSDSDGKGTPVYAVCQPNLSVNAHYYAFIVREMARSQWILALSRGIRERSTDFRYQTFGVQPVPLPPPAEQAAIVQFLDWTNARLERTIRAKRKVIALLTEQKQAVIHRAVTRGLDSSVPLKPSGIPWLGEIPQHWEVSRVKNEFACLNTQRIPLNAVERGGMKSRLYDYYGASGVIDKVDNYLFDDELLLIAEDGANLVLRHLPLAIIARGKFWVNNHAHILKPKRGNILYLAHLMETLNYTPWISGAAQPKLTKDRLLSISISVAPPDEQDAIVGATTEQTRPLAAAINRFEREIELLREYRTRLVADVVTGKLDVREVAAGLPDELSPEPSEDTAESDGGAELPDEEAAP
jgi:type I restriction enzyme S subunit